MYEDFYEHSQCKTFNRLQYHVASLFSVLQIEHELLSAVDIVFISQPQDTREFF